MVAAIGTAQIKNINNHGMSIVVLRDFHLTCIMTRRGRCALR